MYDMGSGHIRSAAFAGKCMGHSTPEHPSVPFGLLDCLADDPLQSFTYDAPSMEFRVASDPTLSVWWWEVQADQPVPTCRVNCWRCPAHR